MTVTRPVDLASIGNDARRFFNSSSSSSFGLAAAAADDAAGHRPAGVDFPAPLSERRPADSLQRFVFGVLTGNGGADDVFLRFQPHVAADHPGVAPSDASPRGEIDRSRRGIAA